MIDEFDFLERNRYESVCVCECVCQQPMTDAKVKQSVQFNYHSY